MNSLSNQFPLKKINLVFGCGGERDKPKRKIMGRIANKYCNNIYLTDDNPRGENPKKIRNQIKTNINKRKLIEIASEKLQLIGQSKILNLMKLLWLQERVMKLIKNIKIENIFLIKIVY